jgi:hypothetical protein
MCLTKGLGDSIQGRSFGLHTYVGIMLQHSAGNVASDAHNGLIAGKSLCEFCNRCVAQIVKPDASHEAQMETQFRELAEERV